MEVERELLLELLFMAMDRLQSYLTDGQKRRYLSSCLSLENLLDLSSTEAYRLYIEDKKKWDKWDKENPNEETDSGR